MNIITFDVTKRGTISWKLRSNANTFYYHKNAGPAVEWINGDKEWWVDGKLHNPSGPASESEYGVKWYVDSNLHRLDGPACEWTSGYKEWFIHGIRHDTELEYWIAVQNYNTNLYTIPYE